MEASEHCGQHMKVYCIKQTIWQRRSTSCVADVADLTLLGIMSTQPSAHRSRSSKSNHETQSVKCDIKEHKIMSHLACADYGTFRAICTPGDTGSRCHGPGKGMRQNMATPRLKDTTRRHALTCRAFNTFMPIVLFNYLFGK